MMSNIQKYHCTGIMEQSESGVWHFDMDVSAACAQHKATIADLQERLARSEAALRRIDSLNDNPACFNVDIQEALDTVLATADGKQPCDQCDDPECPVNQRNGGEA